VILIVKNADIEGKFEGTINVAEILNVKSKAVSTRSHRREIIRGTGADLVRPA
jgi:hypothetical protein